MKSRIEPYAKTPSEVNWTILAVLFVGLGLIIAAHAGQFRTFYEHGAYVEVALDTLRDLGIACVVSSIIGKLFELYRSLRHSLDSMKDVVDATMSDKLTKDVWFQLQDLIDKKRALRTDLRIRLEVERDKQLQPHEAKLRAEIEYEIEGIGRRRHPVTLTHDLDYQLTNEELGLPCFERITISERRELGTVEANATTYGANELKKLVVHGRFSKEVGSLKGGESLRVQVVRDEVVHLPGSYNLYTPEFTMGLMVNVARVPDDIKAEVWVRPQGEGRAPARQDCEWRTDQLILPGQGIEIKFLSRTSEANGTEVPPPKGQCGQTAAS